MNGRKSKAELQETYAEAKRKETEKQRKMLAEISSFSALAPHQMRASFERKDSKINGNHKFNSV